MLGQRRERVGPCGNRVIDPERLAAEVEAVLAHVERRNLAAVQTREDHAAGADGTGANDENAIAFLYACAANRMRSNREELDHRRLVERDPVCRRDIAFGHADVICHPAVDMDAEHRDALAAIGLAAPAGDTLSARDVRDHEHLLAYRGRAPGPGLLDLARQFVSDDARIVEKRVRTFEDMQVRAANPRSADAHENVARLRHRPRPFDHGQFAWLNAKQGPQRRSPVFIVCSLSIKDSFF